EMALQLDDADRLQRSRSGGPVSGRRARGADRGEGGDRGRGDPQEASSRHVGFHSWWAMASLPERRSGRRRCAGRIVDMSEGRQRRDTAQRRALRAAFERADRPLSPAELLAAAQSDVPGLGLATVYRTVRALLDEGW